VSEGVVVVAVQASFFLTRATTDGALFSDSVDSLVEFEVVLIGHVP
jgi:hypothetical protein